MSFWKSWFGREPSEGSPHAGGLEVLRLAAGAEVGHRLVVRGLESVLKPRLLLPLADGEDDGLKAGVLQ